MEKTILAHFATTDPILYAAVQKTGLKKVQKRTQEEYFTALTSDIIGQQLSGKVADVIFERFLSLFPNKTVTPQHLLTLSHEQLRACGMSNAKAYSLRDLTEKVMNKEIHLQQLDSMDNEAVIAELTKVKGIGRWTAEMFLMFSLGRTDLFSLGDQGLKNAIKRLYKLDEVTPEVLTTISNKWTPYRTYACLILWQSLENS